MCFPSTTATLQVHLLTELPTTGSGKVLKTELRKRFMHTATATAAPTSAVDEQQKVQVAFGGMTAMKVAASIVSALGGEGSGFQQLYLDQQLKLADDAAYLLPLVDNSNFMEQVGKGKRGGARGGREGKG